MEKNCISFLQVRHNNYGLVRNDSNNVNESDLDFTNSTLGNDVSSAVEGDQSCSSSGLEEMDSPPGLKSKCFMTPMANKR